MISNDQDADVQVRREDQNRINEFGQNKNHLDDLTGDMKILQKRIDNLEDASTELMVADNTEAEGAVRILLGDAFVQCDEEFATEYCEKQAEKLQQDVDALREEREALLKRQDELKRELYGRFGSAINLEEK